MKKIFYILIALFIPFFVLANTENIDSKIKFDLGTYTNSNYNNSGFLELNNAVLTGEYESQIFDLQRETSFSLIKWRPNFPIGKELPNGKAIEGIYTGGNIDMTDNVLLMHLNESTGVTSFSDSSGTSNMGTCTGANCPQSTNGILNTAIHINGQDLSRVSILDNDTLDPADSEFSICHWFKADSTSGSKILYNKENLYEAQISSGYYRYAWRPHWAWDGGNTFSVNTGEWYHACVVYDKAKQVMYKNGVEVYRRNQTGDIGSNANNLCLGARGTNNCNNSRYTGDIDEFSVWKKALTSTEVRSIYERGISKLGVKVMSCDDNQCLGENYSTLFLDDIQGNNLYPSINLGVQNNQYFRLKIFLETSDMSFSPKLDQVSFEYEAVNHSPTDIIIDNLSQDENTVINTKIGELSVSDIDSGDTHTFSLSCSTPGIDDNNFNIVGVELRNSVIFDYENKNSYNICVKVDDNEGGIFEKNFVIDINDINITPTDILLSNNNINENIPSGSIIATLSSVDDGEDGSLDYTLEVFADSSKFSINNNQQLVINESPDYETQSSYNLRIKVDDGVNNFIKDFVINVNDSIENTAPIILNNQEISVEENNNFITTINIQDNDIPAQSFIYFISGGDDKNKFSMNSSTGKLYFLDKKDYELPNDSDEDNTYNVEISVIDNGQPRLISSKIFNVKILDQKESKGKSRKIYRSKSKIIYKDRIIYKEVCSASEKNKETENYQIKLGDGKKCTSSQILTQNMKSGDKNGKYSSWEKGIVKEVKILQTHMNRLGFNSGEVDGILGPITDGAIKRMQKYLGTYQDGLVGPITRGLINNSCK